MSKLFGFSLVSLVFSKKKNHPLDGSLCVTPRSALELEMCVLSIVHKYVLISGISRVGKSGFN